MTIEYFILNFGPWVLTVGMVVGVSVYYVGKGRTVKEAEADLKRQVTIKDVIFRLLH